MTRLGVVVLGVLAFAPWSAKRAEACACCDAKFRRTPVGWTQAGGAILIDAMDTLACEHKRRLEIWHVGGKEPAGCYDLFGDPEQRISCADLTPANGRRQKPKTSSRVAQFPKAAVQLDSSKVRVQRRWPSSSADSRRELRVTVEVERGGAWHRVWTGVVGPADTSDKPSIDASLWPNARGDRALLIVSYVQAGHGNEAVDVHWATLPSAP